MDGTLVNDKKTHMKDFWQREVGDRDVSWEYEEMHASSLLLERRARTLKAPTHAR